MAQALKPISRTDEYLAAILNELQELRRQSAHRDVSIEELQAVPGVGAKTAVAIQDVIRKKQHGN